MRDRVIPANHGAWIVLITGLGLGTLFGGDPSTGTLALSLTAVAVFCAAERLLTAASTQGGHPRALRSGLVAASIGTVTGMWTLAEVGVVKLAWVLPCALLLAMAERRLSQRKASRPVYELVGMSALVLALPAASLASGCPIGWPLAALSLAFLIHVVHAVLRTHAHLKPKRLVIARVGGLIGIGLVVLLAALDGLPWIVALAVIFGLVEPWVPSWSPMPAKRIGRRETVLILALPLAWLLAVAL